MRILGPLDPLLWNRALVELVFGFAYVWEVYVPRDRRRWGYYVTPLLYGGQLVGRAELRVDTDTASGGVLRVAKLWWEEGVEPVEEALEAALQRHAEQQLRCGGVIHGDRQMLSRRSAAR